MGAENRSGDLLKLGLVFYLGLILLAQVISYYSQGKNLLVSLYPENLLISLIIGILTGTGLFLVMLLSFKLIDPFRCWSQQVILPLLGQFDRKILLSISVLAGISEELFFRGALQPVIGLALASLLFGFVHFFGKKEFAFYGFIAALMGLVMGLTFILTDEILVPVIVHSLYNFLVIGAYISGLFD